MTPGPAKRFDPDLALEQARDLFWRRGFAGVGISELEAELGIGRKSLYDTFGSKRELYLRSIEQYTDAVIGRICAGLSDARNDPLANLERVLGKLQEHHGSDESMGCLLGVAMAQLDAADDELAALLRGYLQRLESAFEATIRAAQAAGDLRNDVRPKDAAREFVALTQGMALMGRVGGMRATQRSIVRAALQSLRA
ncbi:MAG: TetR/AcrR family transcriptional regulator [Myxococcales bacterium]|nr:TetR/AcrR family transcriptional regulator [Myxococcales bacterium]